MRGDCRSNDTVSRFTGKFFTGQLLEILNICAANSANRESGDDNLWREIRSSPDRRRYVVTHLAWSRSDKKRIERPQKLVWCSCLYAIGACHRDGTHQGIVTVYADRSTLILECLVD